MRQRGCEKRWISDLAAGRGAGPWERPRASASGVGHLHGRGPGGARSGASLRAGDAALAAGPTRVRGRAVPAGSALLCGIAGAALPAAEPRFVPGGAPQTHVWTDQGKWGLWMLSCVALRVYASLRVRVCVRAGCWLVFVVVFFPPPPLACSRFYFWLPVRVLLLPSEILY